jgi:hypothetical protein
MSRSETESSEQAPTRPLSSLGLFGLLRLRKRRNNRVALTYGKHQQEIAEKSSGILQWINATVECALLEAANE